jgi:hypothetical protein
MLMRMKRWVLAAAGACAITGVAACSGTTTVASSPSPTAKVTATPSASSSAAASPATATTTITGAGTPTATARATAPAGKGEVAAATSYYRTIAARNYRLAFTYLAAHATGFDGQKLTWPAFLQLARTMDSAEGPLTSFSVAAYGSLVVMTNSREKTGTYHAHLQMARAGDGWIITSIDRI